MSRKITVTLTHDLGKDEARRRIAEGFEKLRGGLSGGMMMQFSQDWVGSDKLTFAAKGLGQNVSGEIDIFPQHVRIEATLPTLLAVIAETIAGKVERDGKLLLEKK